MKGCAPQPLCHLSSLADLGWASCWKVNFPVAGDVSVLESAIVHEGRLVSSFQPLNLLMECSQRKRQACRTQ